MRTDIKYISITGVLLLILLTACSEESGWENIVGTNKYLQIEGEIAGTDVVTKVTGDDLGTNIRFTEGDQIGFYSFHKNKCAGGTQSSHPDSETCADPGRYLVGRKRYVHVGSLLVGIPRIAGVTASRQ